MCDEVVVCDGGLISWEGGWDVLEGKIGRVMRVRWEKIGEFVVCCVEGLGGFGEVNKVK